MSAIRPEVGGRERPDDERLKVRRAGLRDLRGLWSFFATDAEANLFHLGVLEERGVRSLRRGYDYWIAANGWTGQVRAAAFVATTGMASAVGDSRAVAALARAAVGKQTLRLVVGERKASDELWARGGVPAPRLRRDHRLFVYDGAFRPDPMERGVRPARVAETESVVRLAAAMRAEELGRHVSPTEADEFARRIAARVAAGRVYVLVRDGQVLFKADVGARCAEGVQVEGVYVSPSARGRGLGGRCMAEVTRQLCARWPRVTLHVHERNGPAIRAYERAGYRPAHPFRLILAD